MSYVTTFSELKVYTKKKQAHKACFFFVVPGGLEPPLAEPKSVVLPLHHGTIASAKVRLLWHNTK